MIDLRPVAYVIGRILIVLAILMVAPAVLDWRGGDGELGLFRAIGDPDRDGGGMALSMASANGWAWRWTCGRPIC
jgi:trk system potassium uptake protein TrkH